jgi:MFS family permease
LVRNVPRGLNPGLCLPHFLSSCNPVLLSSVTNPYESPRFVAAPKRWLWCTFIIAFWMFSAAMAGFVVGWFCYYIPGFERVRQSPQWQVAAVFAAGAALITFPLGVRRTARLNQRLSDVYARRAELTRQLEAELRARGKL